MPVFAIPTPAIPRNEAARLEAVMRYQLLDTPAEPSFDGIVRLAAHILDCPIALLSIVDAQRQWFKARYGFAVSETPREASFCAHAVTLESTLVVPDATLDARFKDNPSVTGEPGIRFYAGVPLITPDGFVLGTVCGIDRRPRELSTEKLAMLKLLAEQVMDGLELRRKNLELARESAAYEEERATLLAMLEQAPGAIGFWTRELTNGYGNAQYCRIFGRSREALYGLHARELLGSAAYDRSYPHLLGALRGEQQSFENVWTTPSGEQQEVHVEYTPFIYGGQVLGVMSHSIDMTARNQATRAFMHSQATQRALLDALPGIALQLGPDGCIAALYGRGNEHPLLRRAELRGRSWRELMTGLNLGHRAEQFEETLRRAHEHQRAEVFEFELSVDGEIRYYEARVAPASDLLDTICLLLDVTQRSQAEANLRANEVFLATVVRHAPVGIGVFGSSRGYLLANQVFQSMRGLLDDDLPADEKLLRRYFDKDGKSLAMEDLPRARALRTGQPVIGTTVGIEVEDGRRCFFEVNAVPIPESPNQIVIIAIDITQKIEQERALCDYSGRLDALINSALDGILTLDEKGNILQANPALVKLCGYDTSELLQQTVAMLAPDILKGKDVQLRVPQPSAGNNALLMNEVVVSRKDGSQFFAEISLSSFEFAGQRLFSAIVRDIQERKLMRARTEFITMVSHELRAPLNTVIGLGEALAEDEREPLTPRQSERIGTMLTSARHLSEVVKDILDLSRIELGMLRLERAACSIAWLCDLSVGMVADAAERKRIVLRKHVECGELKLFVDGRRVMQILVNLLDNAIKFTAPGGQVLLEARQRDTAVEFAISDSGIGIAEADRARLFKPFCQVDSTTNRKFQGTGLGLFLAQRLAILHAGEIALSSIPGTGSCFTLSIPKTTTITEPAHVASPPDRG